MMRFFLHFLIISLFILGCEIEVKAQKGSKIRTVVIDAGHGGKDPGAMGKHSREKHIALAIALQTGKYIEKYLPDVAVIYTRKDDRFIPLHTRAEIANKNNADFFISIHCNSNPNTKAYGSETYTMGLHKSDANLGTAMLENAAILFEDDAEEQYEGFDANSNESYIRFSLFQNEYQDESNLLAAYVQGQFKSRVGRRDRGVNQAGFLVLWRTAMPGVLIELGFISNPTEEKFLMSEKGQSYMASAIYRAFRDYKVEFEKENQVVEIVEPEIIQLEEQPSPEKIEGLNYRVQFFTNRTKVSLSIPRYEGLMDLYVYEQYGLFKYTTGKFKSLNKAKQHLKDVKARRFSDAFIVYFNNDIRISKEEYEQMQSDD